MRRKQWIIITIFLWLTGAWFAWEDSLWRNLCLTGIKSGEILFCIYGKIYDPFIGVLFMLGMACIFCYYIEAKEENKKK